MRVVGVEHESVGLGDGASVDATTVDPPDRYRAYRADRCPTDAGSTPPPSNSQLDRMELPAPRS